MMCTLCEITTQLPRGIDSEATNNNHFLDLLITFSPCSRLVFIIESLEKHKDIYVSNGVRVSRLYVETLGRPQAKSNGNDSGEDRLSRKLTSHES